MLLVPFFVFSRARTRRWVTRFSASMVVALSLASAAFPGRAAEPIAGREQIRFDEGWRFALGHASDPTKDFGHATGFFSYLAKTGFGDGPASPAFDDRGWRIVNLPHDWAVELPFDPRASHSHGYKTVGPRFPEHSVGWYRRTFTIPKEDLGRRLSLTFDGVYRAARVFVNGFYVGEEPSGYLNASYDISDYLNYGDDNVVAVRVDASMEEGWFYEGAGIYRHVWLTKTHPLHLASDGIGVRSKLSDSHREATLAIETAVTNDGRAALHCIVRQSILAPDGQPATDVSSAEVSVPAGEVVNVATSVALRAPRLWSLEDPALHTLVTTLLIDGRSVDAARTPFGVRSLRFDPNAGFFLNDQRVELKGTNNHQDHAGVGVALPDALQEFRIRRLKEMGSNAYRCSHHPPTPELLDVCDRLGMLVLDENRLMGSSSIHLSQLERMIRRDRNHPSVIAWSLGNEEWGIEGNIKGARLTTTMQDFANRLDPTRLTTVAISGGWGGTSTTVAIAGVNYIKQAHPDRQHAQFPQQIIMGTEETTTQGTRGIYVDDRAACHLAPQSDGSTGGNAESGWKYYAARPYAAGVFYWTGFDYRGEPTPFGYPGIASQFGILDTCGFPKDSFYYLQAWWTDQPVLHLSPHWNWPDRVGQKINVRVDSNCDEVELFLNGTSLGRKTMERNSHLDWAATYAPGTLSARGYKNGRLSSETKIETTGAPATLLLTADRAQIAADGRDVAVLTVAALDSAGRVVPTANLTVNFSLSGDGRIIGVGNGDPSSLEPDQFVSTVNLQLIGTWVAPDPAPNPDRVFFAATFDRPAVTTPTVDLVLNALGKKQTVRLNGEALYTDAPPERSRTIVSLDLGKLKPTDNELRIDAEKFDDWGKRETLRQFHPAAFRVVQPAPIWRRTTFNGLAQVIVQSNGQSGSAVLTATAPGLSCATARLECR